MAGAEGKLEAYQPEPVEVLAAGSESPDTVSTQYKRHPMLSPNEWLLESISSILALGLLIGIAIIFWYTDNKPLSAWRGCISLNATISILTTACTTALMHGVGVFIAQSKWLHFKSGPRKLSDFGKFDEASRGIWGCILLLTTVKWNLATLGASITILRLAFPPFAQQVVLIEQRDISSPTDNATFGYAHNYTRSNLANLANTATKGFSQDPGLQSAIIQGLYGINNTEPFKCPGECSWTESYISLGFKAECRNVTQETLQTATCQSEQVTQKCNMTTPGGIELATRAVFSDSATEYYMNASPLLAQLVNSGGLPTTFPEITRFGIYRSTADYNFQMQDINITDCSLFVTAYKYTGAQANGSDFSVNKREVDFGTKSPWIGLGRQRVYTNESKIGNISIPALEMSYYDLIALENFFESSSIVTEWVAGNFVNTNFGIAAALSGDVDISNRFDNMATAMTNYIRYGPNMQSAYGEQKQSEPFAFIRWGYFVVPIVTEGLAILFAILSILSNRRSRNVPLWKSSTLAVLACRHEKRLGLLQTTEKDVNEIKDEAEKVEVRLQ